MSEDQYALWTSAHILATGASESQLQPLLAANRDTFAKLGATYVELCECTQRLFEDGRVPNWPAEHANALVNELKALRAEQRKSFNSGTYGAGYSLREELAQATRKDGCKFMGICCDGKKYPQCQAVQERWDALLAGEREKDARKARRKRK